MPIMSATAFRNWLIARFPDFDSHWNGKRNYSIHEDGSFIHHGVCSEFSQYYQERFGTLPIESVKELFEFIEGRLRLDSDDKGRLANALATCFWENIASTPAGSGARQYMGPVSLTFFSNWHSESNA